MFCALLPMLTACATEPPEPRSVSPVTQATLDELPAAAITARGKLRDLTAAVNRAIDTRELAVLQETGDERAGVRVFELVGLRGEPGLIRVEFSPVSEHLADRRTPRDMTLSVRLGALGDPDREADLLRALAGEIEELAKRER